MFTDPTFTLADQLFWIVDLFCKTMAPEACKRRIGLFGLAVWSRVKRFERRFSALYAMWKAGTLPQARARKSTSPRPSPHSGEGEQTAFDPGAWDAASMDRANRRPASVLPRTFRWLQQMLPSSAAVLAGGVYSLLSNFPEMQAFAAACPQVARMLRPICTMAGLKPPEWLALPKRERVRKKRAPQLSEADEEELRRITARFPDNPAGRSAKRVWRRVFEGKPVDLTKLSPEALGLCLHPPRDDNCPPAKIGYGGRSFGPLPKDYVRPKDWD
jgi:hypothetical protein